MSVQKKAVYAGSFDPLTNGHVDIIKQASLVFDDVTILLSVNPDKNCMFTPEERMSIINQTFGRGKVHAEILPPGTYVADYANRMKECVVFLVRGLGSFTDFQSEYDMSTLNNGIVPGMKTTFFMTSPESQTARSSIVKSLVGPSGWFNVVKNKVPTATLNALLEQKMKSEWDFLNVGAKSGWISNVDKGEYMWNSIVQMYRDRPYHNLFHLNTMFESLRLRGIEITDSLAYMIWFHDIIQGSDDEEKVLRLFGKFVVGDEPPEVKSSEVAYQYLRLFSDSTRQHRVNPEVVSEGIRKTQYLMKHENLTDDEKLLRDADLVGFGDSWSDFSDTTDRIRKEYWTVDVEQFTRNRELFLRKFTEINNPIFNDPSFSYLEGSAHQNISQELDRLRQELNQW